MCRMNLAVEVHRAFDESRDDQSNLYHCELGGRRGTGYLNFLFRKVFEPFDSLASECSRAIVRNVG